MENTMETTQFTINRSLCEIKFIDTDMKNRDIDIFEYIWFKIRENYKNPTDSFTIKFTELSKNIGKYKNQNKSLSESIQRMEKVTIQTNIKSTENQKRFTFKFSLLRVKDKIKGFKVEFNEKIYKLFDKPKSYNQYHQNYVYNLNTKHSKLLYKFIIGYKFLFQKSFYVKSDVLVDIMNIKSDKGMSYIKSYFIDKSIKEISDKTDLKVSIKKVGYEYKNEIEIVKYKVTIDSYEENKMTVDLTKRKRENKTKSQSEIRLNSWLKDIKSEFSDTSISNDIQIVVINNPISHLPIFIDNDYRLTNSLDYFTNNPQQTMDKINEWIESGDFSYELQTIQNYNDKFKNVCLLSQIELKRRGLI